ncbi:hypothetical protein ACIBCS_42215 [Streptomyces phaeochromogenes]|uniref:hypothetical protein n=1 Tax=Streptomyces phaeochromogenes TaxID=1923 RepID=UPI0033DA6272
MAAVHPCPAPAAHRRLMDCHATWHAMADSYMEPDTFRMHLNSLLQSLRNVTFLLQKQKAELPKFDEWYTAFVRDVCPRPLLRWSVKSRNRVVKESDLELLSEFRIRWVMDWLRRGERKFTFPPRMSTRDMLGAIFSDPGNPRVGVVTISRRWVDKALPDYELLHATREVFIELSRLLLSAHDASGGGACELDTRDLKCVTPAITPHPLSCMVINSGILQEHLDLSDGFGIKEVEYRIDRDERRIKQARKRYGGPLVIDPSGPMEMAPKLMESALMVLRRDKTHMNMMWSFRGSKIIDMMSPNYADQNGKYLMFHRLADRVESLRADGVILLNEAWWAAHLVLDENGIPIPARERKDRQEALHILAATREGERLALTVPFTRSRFGKIETGDMLEEYGDAIGSFGPLIPIQERWRQMDDRDER